MRVAASLVALLCVWSAHGEASSCNSKLSWVFKTNSSLGYCHMAMIEQMGDGTLVTTWQAAKVHESYNDQAIYISLSTDGGEKWSNAVQLVSGGKYAVWGPVLHWDAVKSELNLFYAQSGSFDVRAVNRSQVGGDINIITSKDGRSWSAPRVVLPYKSADGVEVPKVTANKPIVLKKSGNWLLPFWQTPSNYEAEFGTKGKQAAGVLISKDGGATFQPHYVPSKEKVIENTLAETRDGSILQLFRTGSGHLYESWSHDGGETWSNTTKSAIPNPNAKTFMFNDANGDQILAYNPTSKGRNPLALARSTDNGKTFKEFCNLDPGMKSKALEYPTALQVGSRILTVFSGDHYTGIKLSITDAPKAEAEVEEVAACAKDLDCSLNGVCNAGACTCDAGWTGTKCQTLDFIPAERKSGYRNINDPVMGNTSSWGGGGWYDAKDQKWYMWASEMSDHCGMHTWTTNSQTIRASSSTATGLYKREALQFPIWSHEAAVTRGPAGEYVAFFSYNPNPGPSRPVCKLCTDGSTNPVCKKKLGRPFIEVTDPTYMSWSATADGKWSEPVLVLGPTIVKGMTPMDTNMAVVINKDGSVTGMWRDHHPTGKSVPHLVTATNFKDPATYKFSMADLLFGKKEDDSSVSSTSSRRRSKPSANPGGLEDMFLWVDARGHYHAVFHQMYKCETCTAHACSEDGTTWKYTGTAATADTVYTDGTKETFGHSERPHILFDKDGTTPVALTNGVKVQGLSNDDLAFTLMRPLRQKSDTVRTMFV